MDQSLPPADAPPILLDKSAVPRGQTLPVCQDQFLPALFQSVENNIFFFKPQMDLHLSPGHVSCHSWPGG